MVAVRNGLSASLAGLVVLLTTLSLVAGVAVVGWAAGIVCALVLRWAVVRAASARQVRAFGPADLVTLARATLACGVAALTATSFVRPPEVMPLVGLATVALVLDAVDGRVARRTATVSELGALLDGEADAFLMLVLSVYLAPSVGAWVLAIGLVRYAFALAGRILPWMRRRLPPRYWRKVVTAAAGIGLTFAAAMGPAEPEATYAALAVVLVLLGESFGRDVWWLWRRRPHPAAASTVDVAPAQVPLP